LRINGTLPTPYSVVGYCPKKRTESVEYDIEALISAVTSFFVASAHYCPLKKWDNL
jgi:hypothetical protein